jgi:hypothetical protein
MGCPHQYLADSPNWRGGVSPPILAISETLTVRGHTLTFVHLCQPIQGLPEAGLQAIAHSAILHRFGVIGPRPVPVSSGEFRVGR